MGSKLLDNLELLPLKGKKMTFYAIFGQYHEAIIDREKKLKLMKKSLRYSLPKLGQRCPTTPGLIYYPRKAKYDFLGGFDLSKYLMSLVHAWNFSTVSEHYTNI